MGWRLLPLSHRFFTNVNVRVNAPCSLQAFWQTSYRTGWVPRFIWHLALFTPRQRQDVRVFHKLWNSWLWKSIIYVVGDKGYEGKIRSHGAISVIPPKVSRVFPETCDTTTRLKIELFFAHLKENKRLAMWYDKRDCTFTAFFCGAIMKLTNLSC